MDKLLTKMLYNTEEARKMLGIGRTTLYALMAEGKVKSVKVHGKRMFRASDLESFVDSLQMDGS